MQRVEVGGKSARWPGGRVCTVKSEGIVVMAVDIDGTYARSRRIVSTGIGIIVDQRHDDTSIASLVLDVLHVAPVGEVHTTASTGVFILGLVEDDRSAVGNLGFGNSLRDVGHVTDW